MAISIIKLSSGETVIADVLSYDDETYDLEVNNPLQLTMTEDLDSRKMQMFTSAWIPLFGEDTVVEIIFGHIITVAEATVEMVEYYYSSLDEMRMKEGRKQELTEEMRGEV
ncbi:MAG: hypothetical protein H8D23_04245, partial [Candidatus Brocadiales bacterium]|nr:hypothetical protein [Candidatus Brocadiales bacterium]